jgi:hypothetical protein
LGRLDEVGYAKSIPRSGHNGRTKEFGNGEEGSQ